MLNIFVKVSVALSKYQNMRCEVSVHCKADIGLSKNCAASFNTKHDFVLLDWELWRLDVIRRISIQFYWNEMNEISGRPKCKLDFKNWNLKIKTDVQCPVVQPVFHVFILCNITNPTFLLLTPSFCNWIHLSNKQLSCFI